jgi:hypothetical protein
LKEAKLLKVEVRCLKAHLTLATADMQAAKVMMRNPDALDLDRLRCHVVHIIESGGEILKLLDDDQSHHPDSFEAERPVMLDLNDPESLVTGRITIDPAKVPTNGAGKEVNHLS